MKMELLLDGKVIDTIAGSPEWIASVIQDRMSLSKADQAREVPDDTPDLLKTASGKPWWMA